MSAIVARDLKAVDALANIYGDDVLVPSAVGRQFAF